MGSIALFFILAIVMIGTRKVNWYAVEAAAVPRKAP
jgi:inner membrane protein involved in colicin E2 resistance